MHMINTSAYPTSRSGRALFKLWMRLCVSFWAYLSFSTGGRIEKVSWTSSKNEGWVGKLNESLGKFPGSLHSFAKLPASGFS